MYKNHDDHNARELLSGLTVLIEGKYLVTGFYLNPFDLEPPTKATMCDMLRDYVLDIGHRFPGMPHTFMGDMNPTTIEDEVVTGYFDSLERTGHHFFDSEYEVNPLDFVGTINIDHSRSQVRRDETIFVVPTSKVHLPLVVEHYIP
jgi:hypothetical protein